METRALGKAEWLQDGWAGSTTLAPSIKKTEMKLHLLSMPPQLHQAVLLTLDLGSYQGHLTY